jgi:hypothetical protein
MLRQQAGLEHLAGNARAAPRPGAATRVGWDAARAAWRPVRRPRDMQQPASRQLPAAPPTAWVDLLGQTGLPRDWEVGADGCWVQFSGQPRS